MNHKKPAFFFPAFIAIVIGVFGPKTFQLVGTLRVDEVIGLVCLILLIPTKHFLNIIREPSARFATIVLCCWALVQLLCDFHNQTDWRDMLKGSANLGFSLTTFLFLAILFWNRLNVVIIYLLAKLLGNFLFHQDLITSDEILSNEFWDLRVNYWASPLAQVIAILFVGRWRFSVATGLLIVGATAVAFGGRSVGLVYCFASLALFLSSPAIRHRASNITLKQFKQAAMTAVITACLLFPAYVFVASKGLINSKAQDQILSIDNPYNPIEVLLAGRYGIQYGIKAVSKRPVAGYGSRCYSGDYLPGSVGRGGAGFIDRGRIAYNYIHSIILESATYGGIVCGALSLALLFCTLARCMDMLALRDHRATFIAAFVAASVSWAFLASPLASLRLGWPIGFAMTYAFVTQRRNATNQVYSYFGSNDKAIKMLPNRYE